jgi:hypothetical protein
MALTRLNTNSIGASSVDLTSKVTGALPVANGGTALTSGFVNGAAAGGSQVYMTGDTAISGDGYLTSNLSVYNSTGTGNGIASVSSGVISLDKTGYYHIIYQFTGNSTSGTQVINPYIATTTNSGASSSNRAYGYAHGNHSDDDTFTCTINLIHDLTDTSEAFLMKYQGASNITLYGTGQSVTSMTFIRLGDT